MTEHPLISALRPLADALGACLVPADKRGDADVELTWDGEVVGAVRLPPIHGSLDRLIGIVEAEFAVSLPALSREQKQAAIRRLDELGAFTLRRAVEDIAAAMEMSRITVYSYLNAIHR